LPGLAISGPEFGPSFVRPSIYSPVMWSVIFQVAHFPRHMYVQSPLQVTTIWHLPVPLKWLVILTTVVQHHRIHNIEGRLITCQSQKLSHRRETARQLRTSFSARSLHRTPHLLYN